MSDLKIEPPHKKFGSFKGIDKFLNIAIVVFGLLWAVSYCVPNPDTPEPKSLNQEAKDLFAEGDDTTGRSKETSQLPDSTTITTTQEMQNLDPEAKQAIKATDAAAAMPAVKRAVPIITAEALVNAIEATDAKPLVLFLFASWCPHCQNQFPLLNNVANNNEAQARFMAISLDEYIDVLGLYLTKVQPDNSSRLQVYGTGPISKRREIALALRDKGLEFDGAIPYTAIFTNGMLDSWFKGLLSEKTLLKTLQDIKTASREGSDSEGDEPTTETQE